MEAKKNVQSDENKLLSELDPAKYRFTVTFQGNHAYLNGTYTFYTSKGTGIIGAQYYNYKNIYLWFRFDEIQFYRPTIFANNRISYPWTNNDITLNDIINTQYKDNRVNIQNVPTIIPEKIN